jgi:hypothetical protein
MPLILLLLCLLALPAQGQVLNLTKITTLSSSGNFTVPANVYQITVNMCGGGGGGGGVTAAAASAAGGTSGAWAVFDRATTPGEVIAYVVGAAGAAGAAGNNSGGTGGDTTFGVIVAEGGVGGNGSAAGNADSRTVNEVHTKLRLYTSTVARRFLSSGINLNGAGQTVLGGHGGTPGDGTGYGGTGALDAAGAVGTGFCSGGAGANNAAGTTARAGGAGTAGTIVLTY